MRHNRRSRRFDRTSSHLKAMMRNMTASLIMHERIVTTPQKAKECRRFAERLVTIAKKGGPTNFRRALAILVDKNAVRRLFKEIAPRYARRAGGYTRILHLSDTRLGDNARQCIFELVEEDAAKRKPKVQKVHHKKTREEIKAERAAEKAAEEEAVAAEKLADEETTK
jgi:large subunit ribosomal protein L17